MKRLPRIGQRFLASAVFATILLPAPVAVAGTNRWTVVGSIVAHGVAVDPRDGQTVYASDGFTVSRSRDGGQTWSSLLRMSNVFGAGGLAIDPQSPDTVYAVSGDGLFRTIDAGGTWTNIGPSGGPAVSVALHPTNDAIIHAATPGRLHRSTDRGTSWTTFVAQSVFNVAIAPSNPDTVYGYQSSVSYYYGSNPARLYRSTDGGQSWTTETASMGFHHGSLAIHPSNSSTLYVGAYGLFKSEDSGRTWRLFAFDESHLVTDVLFDKRDARTMLASTSQGVFRSSDGGQNWSNISNGLRSTFLMSLETDSTGRLLYGTGWDARVYSYRIYQGPLDLTMGPGHEASYAFVSPHGAGIRRIDDAGVSIESFDYASGQRSAAAIARGSDDLTWLLWNGSDGSTTLQVSSSLDAPVLHGYASFDGWTAVDISSASNRTAVILWTHADGRVGLWTVDSFGAASGHATFGPYVGWTARGIAHGADGRLRLLWTHGDGRIGISTIDGGQIVSTYRFTPEAGWSARDLTVAIDGQARILMDGPDDQMALWSVSDSGVRTEGPIHASPSAGQSASRLSAGLDGMTRVLWTSPEGVGTVYLMSLDGSLQGSFGLN
jgi:hypothetical protein